MRVVFMGTPEFAVPSLMALHERGADIQGVVTQPDRPHGRGNKILYSPIKECALKLGLKIWQPLKIMEIYDDLAALETDFYAVVAFGQLLPKRVLEAPKLGCVNVHGSLLPKYRGAAPVARAIAEGETETGATIMLLDEGMDTGPMLLKEVIPILDNDTAGSLAERMSHVGARLLADALEGLLAGKIQPEAQNHHEATYAPKIAKEDGRIDWSMPAEKICRRIRAFSPWPGAYTSSGGKMLKVWRARPAEFPEGGDSPAGAILLADAKKGFFVKTGDAAVALEEVQLEGRKRQPAAELLRGFSPEIGDILA